MVNIILKKVSLGTFKLVKIWCISAVSCFFNIVLFCLKGFSEALKRTKKLSLLKFICLRRMLL